MVLCKFNLNQIKFENLFVEEEKKRKSGGSGIHNLIRKDQNTVRREL